MSQIQNTPSEVSQPIQINRLLLNVLYKFQSRLELLLPALAADRKLHIEKIYELLAPEIFFKLVE